ncbi:histidine phosphatase family protein [uncultured Sulfitobacter sp.]|uniref:SixA phosphatase family protein n=1 Tax=uncultured Sulfitobacter sp. TaxID=191468 RepID=UPI002609CE5C|nr:histidine phosphatase family protein [uncultured Sulfitobacter sp.]
MKRLILMRHAKSGWDDLSATDHQRHLNGRGVKSAKAMGHWLRDEGLRPDHILCSDAARTQETLSGLGLADIPTTFTRDLYLAEDAVMVRILMRQTSNCVLMVAHNPGTALLAARLLGTEPDHPDFDTYPTCATLVADFEIETWRDLKMGTGRLVHFAVPRDIIE